MNVLKVFNKYLNAEYALQNFVEDNYGCVKSYTKDKVDLYTGHSVYFRVINTMEDAHKTSGMCFSWVEWYGGFEPSIKQYICSRIREA